jgi:hypothetical protein
MPSSRRSHLCGLAEGDRNAPIDRKGMRTLPPDADSEPISTLSTPLIRGPLQNRCPSTFGQKKIPAEQCSDTRTLSLSGLTFESAAPSPVAFNHGVCHAHGSTG